MNELPKSASWQVIRLNSKKKKKGTYILDRFLDLVRDGVTGLPCPCRGKPSPEAIDRVCCRFTTSLPFSPTSIEFDEALGGPHVVRVDCLIGLGEPVGRKRSVRAVLLMYAGQYSLSPDLQCLPICIFATICHRFKDLGVISESLVVVVTVFSSAFGSVGRGPALTAHCSQRNATRAGGRSA